MLSENLRTDDKSGRINWHNWWDCGHNYNLGTSVLGSACSVAANNCDPPPLAVSFGCGNSCHPNDDAGVADSARYPVFMTTRLGTNNAVQQGNISSNHGNGSNVIFCDGHGQFLSSNLDNSVYTPPAIGVPGTPTQNATKSIYELLVNPNDMGDPGSPVLDEASYSR